MKRKELQHTENWIPISLKTKIMKIRFFFWQKWQQRKEKYQDINAWWDNRKNIQDLTKDFCTDLKQTEKNHLHKLQRKLQTLYTRKKTNTRSKSTTKFKIEELEWQQQKGRMVRNRTKLIEGEEKTMKIFFVAEQPN